MSKHIRFLFNWAMIFIIIIMILGVKGRCGDADIYVFVEYDRFSGRSAQIDDASSYLSEASKDDTGEKKAMKKMGDEYGIIGYGQISQSQFISFANLHDTLSENNDWWCYLLAVHSLTTGDLGWTDPGNDPNNINDNNHSCVADETIDNTYDEEHEDIAEQLVSAHELFHQFGYESHCTNQSCVNYNPIQNPLQDMMCDYCLDKFKDGGP